MIEWLNETHAGKAVKSYLKTFVAVVLGLFLADGADLFSVDLHDLRAWFAAGLAAVLPLFITALDPSDTRFGTNANGDVVEVVPVDDVDDLDFVDDEDLV